MNEINKDLLNLCIKELEKMVKSMAAQMQYMQTMQEKTERQLMDSQHDDTQNRLYNMELQYQVEDTEKEKKWAEEEIQEELSKVKQECESLRYSNAFSAVDLIRKQKECDDLKQELYDKKCIMNYVQNQATDIRNMIKSKLTIEE